MTHNTHTPTIAAAAAQAHKYYQARGMVYYHTQEDFCAGHSAVDSGDPLTLAAEAIYWRAIDAHSARLEVAQYKDTDAAQKSYAAAQKSYAAAKRAAAIAREELLEAKNFLTSVR